MAITFIWDDSYSVGVAELDEQHKQLIGTIARINDAINNRSINHEMMMEVFVDLNKYVNEHFSAEEKYFDKFGFEFAEEHLAEHREFAKKLKFFSEGYSKKEVEVSFELINFLEDWLLDHILTMDRKYMECFAKNGLK